MPSDDPHPDARVAPFPSPAPGPGVKAPPFAPEGADAKPLSVDAGGEGASRQEVSGGAAVTEGGASSAPVAGAKAAAKSATAAEFFSALGNEARWAAVKMLADGQELTSIQIAKALGRDFDMVSKHMRILRRVGAVKRKRGEDERTRLYFIPPENRPEPGVLQWGWLRVQLRPPEEPGGEAQ